MTLVANLPSGANFFSASGSCTHAGKGKSDGTLTCNVGALAAGSSTAVTIVVQPTSVGTISLTAKAYADQPDPNQGNNTATETTTIVK